MKNFYEISLPSWLAKGFGTDMLCPLECIDPSGEHTGGLVFFGPGGAWLAQRDCSNIMSLILSRIAASAR